MLFQQGDVLIESCIIPRDAEKASATNGRYILAEGEATGHAHAVVADSKVSFYRKNGKLYLSVKEEAEIIHEEHESINLPVGDFLIRNVQEYDHFREESRRVAD